MRSLDAADLPPALRPVTELLQERTGSVSAAGPWLAWKGEIHSLLIRIEVPPNINFPVESFWHLVVSTSSFPASVDIYPDSKRGPDITYPHQNAVGSVVSGKPWRNGNLCLGNPRDAWGERLGNIDEPLQLPDRLVWTVQRFERWCLTASEGLLHRPGDHFEMPALPGGPGATRIGFYETGATLAGWHATEPKFGIASLVEVSSPTRALAVQAWNMADGTPIAKPAWGAKIGDTKPANIPCLWLRLSSLPILEAWQLPRTFAELQVCVQKDGHDLGEIFASFGNSVRKSKIKGKPMLMLGFPVPEKFGARPVRMHWLGLSDIPLKRKNVYLTGYRSNEESRQKLDRMLANSGRKLTWAKCENWAPDQVRSRVHEPPATQDPLILLIGAGSLGSQVAESLARSGIKRIEIQDADFLSAGNLCRHALDMSDLGRFKAEALADRLNRLQPDMRSTASVSSFPAREASDRPYDQYDVILDCSGENSVLRAIGYLPWNSEKRFVSLSMTWAAKGLLVWSSLGTAIPAGYVIDSFSTLIERQTDRLPRAEIMEGIGCWHPVFPANPADVQLWAATGARFLLEALASNAERCGIFRFTDGGGIAYVDA